jgi:hypothetical protein
MTRPSSEYRDAARDALSDDHELSRLRRLAPFRAARDLVEARRIAEAVVRMSNEEVDRLRESLASGRLSEDTVRKILDASTDAETLYSRLRSNPETLFV